MISDITNTKEVAKLLKLHRKTVVALANRGDLPHFWVGGSLRFLHSDIEQYVREQRQASTQKE